MNKNKIKGPSSEALNYFDSLHYKCPEFSSFSDYLMEILHPDFQSESKNERFALFCESYKNLQEENIMKAIGYKC